MLYLGMFWTLGVWLALTLWMDLVVIPSVFRSGLDFFQAGDLGIYLFSSFNLWEIFFSIVLIVFIGLLLKGTRRHGGLAWFFLPLSILPFIYFFGLTPQITIASKEMAHAIGGSDQSLWASSQYQFYHRIYIWLDSIKMIWIVLGHVLIFKQYRLALRGEGR